jgi:hypothetical protein
MATFLSRRALLVLQLLARGYTSAQIASFVGDDQGSDWGHGPSDASRDRAGRDIQDDIAAALRALQVSTISEAIQAARERNLILAGEHTAVASTTSHETARPEDVPNPAPESAAGLFPLSGTSASDRPWASLRFEARWDESRRGYGMWDHVLQMWDPDVLMRDPSNALMMTNTLNERERLRRMARQFHDEEHRRDRK